MKIRLSNATGFCSGVQKAISHLDQAIAAARGTVYIDGPLIHNARVIASFQTKGVLFLEEQTNLTPDDTVVIRAHGVPPEHKEQLLKTGCTLIDSTCPLVSKIHKIIVAHKAQGYSILIAGQKEHPEVIGLIGYAGDAGQVIETPEEIDTLALTPPVLLIAQSTLDLQVFETMKTKLLNAVPDAVIKNTICNATAKRQQALKDLAAECDAVIVVGGRNSSNTKRLYQIAARIKPAFCIESADELESLDLSGFEVVGIAGGASTPEEQVMEIKALLEQQ